MTAAERPESAWLLLRPGTVPPAWRGRATSVVLVPLLPGEAAAMLAGEAPPPGFAGQERFLRLVARGFTGAEIADELHISRSSVARRVASLREHYGVASVIELAAVLAEQGF